MLNKIITRLGASAHGKEMLVYQLLEDAREDVLAYTNLSEIPEGLESTVRELTIIYFNRLGIEGQSSHSEGGITLNVKDMPDTILKRLRRYRKLGR